MKKNQHPSASKGGLQAFLKSRKARHGSVAAAIVIIVIALVVVLNIIVGLLVDRFPNLKADLTSNSAYALQDDTTDYMSHLNKDVKLYILMTESNFESQGTYFVQAKNLLEKMQSSSNGKLKVEYVDTTSNPNFTKQFPNIDWSSNQNVAIAACGDQYKALSLDDCFTYNAEYASYGYYEFESTTIEQAVVTAVLNVTTEDKVVVDILTGSQQSDYSAVSALLNNNAYQVNEVQLLTQDIDSDAAFVILYAPAVDLDDDAVQKISDWLENGGKYGKNLIYVPNAEATGTPNIDKLLDEWQLSLTDGFVFETSSDHLINGASQFAFITEYTDYYTENLKNANIPVVVYQSVGIEINDESAAHALLTTSDRAGIVPYEPDDNWNADDAVKGEPIAVAAESVKSGNDAESRVIVFGADTMFNQSFLQTNSFNNAAFLMNVMNTISDKDDESVIIEGKSLENTELGVTSTVTSSVMKVIFVAVIPIVIIVIGIIVWVRRRNK